MAHEVTNASPTEQPIPFVERQRPLLGDFNKLAEKGGADIAASRFAVLTTPDQARVHIRNRIGHRTPRRRLDEIGGPRTGRRFPNDNR